MANSCYDETTPASPLAYKQKNLEKEMVMVSTQRKEELEIAFKKGAPHGASAQFLDTINSVGELDELILLMRDMCPDEFEPPEGELLSHYREWLTRWPNPKMEDWFRKDFPLVATRLDTPQKMRVFLRGADARGVSPSVMASAFEDIIKKHEVDGQKVVHYTKYRGSTWCRALRVVYHTQLQYWTLTNLMLPGRTFCTIDNDGLWIDWRSTQERIADGDPPL